MDLQTSFNHVCLGLINAPQPSVYYDAVLESDNCKYRGEQGTKCAVGHLIPDEFYSEDMEGLGVGTLWETHFELRPLLAPWSVRDLKELQHHHDFAALKWDPSVKWSDIIRKELSVFAAKHNLKMEV